MNYASLELVLTLSALPEKDLFAQRPTSRQWRTYRDRQTRRLFRPTLRAIVTHLEGLRPTTIEPHNVKGFKIDVERKRTNNLYISKNQYG